MTRPLNRTIYNRNMRPGMTPVAPQAYQRTQPQPTVPTPAPISDFSVAQKPGPLSQVQVQVQQPRPEQLSQQSDPIPQTLPTQTPQEQQVQPDYSPAQTQPAVPHQLNNQLNVPAEPVKVQAANQFDQRPLENTPPQLPYQPSASPDQDISIQQDEYVAPVQQAPFSHETQAVRQDFTGPQVGQPGPANKDPEDRFAAPKQFAKKSPLSKQAKVFSIVTLVCSLVVLGSWLSLARLPGINSVTFIIEIILVIAQIALAAGLLMNFRLKRKVYTVAAAALLAFSVISVFTYLLGLHNLDNYGKKNMAVYQAQIGQYQDMASMSAAQRATTVRVIQGYESEIPAKIAKQKATPIPLATDFLLAGVVIFFLTRPQLRAEMSLNS